MDPKAKKDFVADYDYEFDEKHKTVSVTEQGVAKAENFLGIDHLYRAENGPLVNHLIQALKAESLYKRDVDYAVDRRRGQDHRRVHRPHPRRPALVGGPAPGGRGQGGRARPGGEPDARDDHAAELLPHVRQARGHDGHGPHRGHRVHEDLQARRRARSRPTGRWSARTRTTRSTRPRRASGRAVAREIAGAPRRRGQPVLVGTISVEVSELLSRAPAQARRPAHGAQRQARARRARGRDHRRGRPPRRGHDRHEHGRPRRGHQARRQRRAPDAARARQARPQARATRTTTSASPRSCRRSRRASRTTARRCIEAGGLFICGTERHESRRIDNQLRGRAGRQGDPGESRFFLSAEDDLVRLFAGDRIYRSSTASARPTRRARRSRSRRRCSRSRSRAPSARSRSRTSSSASACSSTTT